MNDLLQSIRRNAIGLGLFALVTAGAIAVAKVATNDRIKRNIELAQARALNEIVAVGSYNNDLLNDTLAIDQRFNQQLLGPLKASDKIHLARRDGEVSTVILPVVAPDGYTMEIPLRVGIHADGGTAGGGFPDPRET